MGNAAVPRTEKDKMSIWRQRGLKSGPSFHQISFDNDNISDKYTNKETLRLL